MTKTTAGLVAALALVSGLAIAALNRVAALEAHVGHAIQRAETAEAAADSAMRLANECAAQVARNNQRVDGIHARLVPFERTYPLGTRR